MNCIHCNSTHVQKDGNHNDMQRYKCIDCKKRFDNGKYITTYTEHFKVKIMINDNNKLTRKNYCIYTTKTDYKTRKAIEKAQLLKEDKVNCFIPDYYLNLPNEYFIDKYTYNEKYAKKYYDDCLYNFDLNMKYFEGLDKNEFNDVLNKYIKKNKFKQGTDLNHLNGTNGIYILVLDEYKQVYIGVSNDIKRRIQTHWSKRKDFGHLIFGSKETSILSIDSFGALDTTRIFYKEIKWYQNIDKLEEKYVKEFNSDYTLNRICGGVNADNHVSIRNLKTIGSMKKRHLK